MTMEKKDHEVRAKELFNRTWELMEMETRELADDLEMLAAAHGSRYHWQHAGAELQWARGEWQLSRVYALLGQAETARFHGERCLAWVEAHDLGAFDLAYAHEALARAAALTGNRGVTRGHIRKVFEAAESIEDEESKKMVLSDVDNITMKH